MFMSRHQTTGQNHYIKGANKSFENVAKFRCFGKVRKQNSIHGEIKTRVDSWNACCHAVHNFLSYCLLSKNVNIKTTRVEGV
jgi:hypothetical protein